MTKFFTILVSIKDVTEQDIKEKTLQLKWFPTDTIYKQKEDTRGNRAVVARNYTQTELASYAQSSAFANARYEKILKEIEASGLPIVNNNHLVEIL